MNNRFSHSFFVCDFDSIKDNGGDGLVCARHLAHFGYQPTVVYPTEPKKDLYKALVVQCETLNIPILKSLPAEIKAGWDVIVDAVFGFSFQGAIRSPFDSILKSLQAADVPIVCIDIPSGWDVENGCVSQDGLQPNMLISLSAPKLCAKHLPSNCAHYVGGRFIPPAIASKYGLDMSIYRGCEQYAKL
eukprot:c8916_g1_i1.p2 GENE.c8916_g1_i1~~c8916_g1_i1.p2  ORF type:complete len:188 (+),score=36.26 c8916_g1_i1:219-782(+)